MYRVSELAGKVGLSRSDLLDYESMVCYSGSQTAISCLLYRRERKVKIRVEKNSDHSRIESLTYQAFENHPHHAPGASPTEHLIVNKLRENGALSLSLVAEDDAEIVGHIAFSPVTIGGEAGNWYGLGPVSVLPNRQGERIGSQLIEAGVATLQKQGAGGIVLLGEPGYYGRFGFKTNENLILPGVPAEYFLIQSLADNETPLPSGEVAYDSAFS